MALLLAQGITAFAAPEPLRLCWESTEKPPYLTLSQSGAPDGISVKLVTSILRQAGLEFRHVTQPWKRCLNDLTTGDMDLVPNATTTNERTQYALFSKAIYRTHMAFFYDARKYPTRPKVRSLTDLKAYRVGGVLGFNYNHLGNTPVDTGAKSREALLMKLEAGRIDLANEQLETMLEIIRQNESFRDRFAYIIDPFVAERSFHIMISKKHPEASALRDRINAAIDILTRNGTLARINGDVPRSRARSQ